MTTNAEIEKIDKVLSKIPGKELKEFVRIYALVHDDFATALAEKYGVTLTVYGHLHGAGIRVAYCGEHHGVRYELTSCDSLGFRLLALDV